MCAVSKTLISVLEHTSLPFENRNPQPQHAWTMETLRHILVQESRFSMEKKGGVASWAQL